MEGDDGEIIDPLVVDSGFRKVNSYAYNMKSNDLNDNDMQVDSYWKRDLQDFFSTIRDLAPSM